eukprot:6208068-Pleurochrysis_carterae.AAC.1
MHERGVVGGENFSLALAPGGDAIVRARYERERWLRAIGATDPRIRLTRIYISRRPSAPHRTGSVETPTGLRLL